MDRKAPVTARTVNRVLSVEGSGGSVRAEEVLRQMTAGPGLPAAFRAIERVGKGKRRKTPRPRPA